MPKNKFFGEIDKIEEDKQIVENYLHFTEELWKEQHPGESLDQYTLDEIHKSLEETFEVLKEVEYRKLIEKRKKKD